MEKPRTLLLVPPFCTPNYVYPSAAYLTRFLRRNDYECVQLDANLELMLEIFTRQGLEQVFAAIDRSKARLTLTEDSRRIIAMKHRYIELVEPIVSYLQGEDPSLAYRLIQPNFLPRGVNFAHVQRFDWSDRTDNDIPIHDRGTFRATQFLYDVAGLIRNTIFPYFQITLTDRMTDEFVHGITTFDRMVSELRRPPNLLDFWLDRIVAEELAEVTPEVVAISIPFARNFYWALRVGKSVREHVPNAKIVLGGGFINTSIREPRDPRLFDYIDYLCLDDGERPLLCILEHVGGQRDKRDLKRTFYRGDEDRIHHSNGCDQPDIKHTEAGAPDYTDYNIGAYFNSLETPNILQRVRSQGWWNKMTLAHGCYWKKCSFCDIHLSYVGDYDPDTARGLVDKVEEVIAQTGQTGFHFVDEAMPPKVMRDFSIELLRRNVHISWHGMLRFDKAFTPDLCKLLAAAGCIGVMGGLEVASDRLLKLMKKGTNIEQVSKVARNFHDAGIRVHAYIMYGFPTQTPQETIDSLDVVRQLFKNNLLTSASWSQFAVTPHSPIGRNPEEYDIELFPVPDTALVEQIIPHSDPTGAEHEKYSDGLHTSLGQYTIGMYFDANVEGWFDFEVPAVSIDRDWIAKILFAEAPKPSKTDRRKHVVWLGSKPSLRMTAGGLNGNGNGATNGNGGASTNGTNGSHGMGDQSAELVLHDVWGDIPVQLPAVWGMWLTVALDRARYTADKPVQLSDLEATWNAGDFNTFLDSTIFSTLRERGLTVV